MFCPIQFSGISQISREKGSSLKISARFWTTLVLLCSDCGRRSDRPFRTERARSMRILLVRVPSREGYSSRTISMPIHSFYTEAAKADREGNGEGATSYVKERRHGRRKGREREGRLSRKLPLRLYGPEERVIPFNRGDWIFPRRGELLAQGAHGSADSPPLPPFRAQPTPGFPLFSSPFPSPSHQPQPARHHPPVSRGQQFRSRDGELPVATARRDGGARTPQPQWNWPAPRRCRR